MTDSPIIIIGSGRSGSTVVFEAISHHSDLAWLSQYYYLLGNIPQIGIIHRFFNKVGEKPQGQKLSALNQLIPRPLEVYPKWAKLCGKQFRYASLYKKSAEKWQIRKTQNFFNQTIKWQSKKRLAIKITGPPRITFLQSIFPNAYFIDIIRHPVAVVNSYLNVNFWNEKGTNKPHWDNLFTEKDYATWKSFNYSETALAALEWRRVFRITEIERKKSNVNFLRIKYEDFLSEPLEAIKKIATFTHLTLDNHVIRHIQSKKYFNNNYKAKKNLSASNLVVIQAICEKEIRELGYELF
ncbi:MAG: sulfotransferase family protein [bacterium]